MSRSSSRLTSRRFSSLVVIGCFSSLFGGPTAVRSDGETTRSPKPSTALPIEASLVDGSTLKVTLRDDHIELQTRYGKLLIPATEISRIDCRWRLAPEVARRIDTAIANLGSKDFHKREAASTALLSLADKAFPALTRAAGDSDAEVSRRAREVLDKIRETVPANRLEVRDEDVVWAGDSKFVGRIDGTSLSVETLAFGVQPLRLSDLRSLRTGNSEANAVAAAPDPGTLEAFQNQVGKTLTFKVTGPRIIAAAAAPPPVGGPGGCVWGTDVYSSDSSLALAAVHAGVVRPGETAVVRVTILGPAPGFQGSTRNGVTSQPYGGWPGSFKVSR